MSCSCSFWSASTNFLIKHKQNEWRLVFLRYSGRSPTFPECGKWQGGEASDRAHPSQLLHSFNPELAAGCGVWRVCSLATSGAEGRCVNIFVVSAAPQLTRGSLWPGCHELPGHAVMYTSSACWAAPFTDPDPYTTVTPEDSRHQGWDTVRITWAFITSRPSGQDQCIVAMLLIRLAAVRGTWPGSRMWPGPGGHFLHKIRRRMELRGGTCHSIYFQVNFL